MRGAHTDDGLTFGAEFEFVVNAQHGNGRDPGHADDFSRLMYILGIKGQVYPQMAAILQQAGFVTTLYKNGAKKWAVTDDGSIHGEYREASLQVGVEVITPKLHAKKQYYEQVRKALEVLTTNFSTDTNATTGLHVHVGNGMRDRFQQDELKSLIALLYTSSPLLKLYTPRIGPRRITHTANR
jgi:hypothetical protein